MSDGVLESAAGSIEDAVIADAVASQSHLPKRLREKTYSGPCMNCGSEITGPFCSVCGQVQDDFKRPFWDIFVDAIEGMFSLDGRAWKTVPNILLRPGRVTKHYLDGQRARFMLPFRLFLFASLVLIIGTNMMPGSSDFWDSIWDEGYASIDLGSPDVTNETADEIGLNSLGLEERITAETKNYERALRNRTRNLCEMRMVFLPERPLEECEAFISPESRSTDEEEAGSAALGVEADMEDLSAVPLPIRSFLFDRLGAVASDPTELRNALEDWLPRMVLFLFPLYAIFLGLLHFWRRSLYFYDHLVVSLHFHAFLCLFTLICLVGTLYIGGWAVLIWMIWTNYALYRTHRLVYEDSCLGSVLRVVILDIGYIFLMAFVLILLFLIGIASA